MRRRGLACQGFLTILYQTYVKFKILDVKLNRGAAVERKREVSVPSCSMWRAQCGLTGSEVHRGLCYRVYVVLTKAHSLLFRCSVACNSQCTWRQHSILLPRKMHFPSLLFFSCE